jgi:hypothetical protein
MPKSQAFSRAICASLPILLVFTLASCSSGGGSGGNSLDAALAQVGDTSATRTQIAYDDTAALVQLSGTGVSTTKGFAPLRGWGSQLLELLAPLARGDTGISVFKEDYAISAGNAPQTVTLLHGGQSGSLVTSRLTKLGWKQNGGTLVGPPFSGGGSQKASLYELQLHVVQTAGSDVKFGGSGAKLSQIGSPSGSTLASNPVISALASCLGDVVAAQIGVGGYLGGKHPVAVAVGVRKPASDSAAPRAVGCVAWSSQAAAAQYTTDAKKALSSGLSIATNQPYSTLLSHPAVTDIGGSEHIVQWQADTASRADLIFQMYERVDLPALPTCTKLPPQARSRVFGCA